MLSWRLLILFLHVVAVIVALGGSLFSTFVLAPVLRRELDAAARIKVARQVLRRLGAIVLSALAVLVITGLGNLLYVGVVLPLLPVKLLLVAIVIGLAIYQYASLGRRIWRLSAAGPAPALAALQGRFRRAGITVGTLVLVIVYLSLGLTRVAGLAAPRF